MLPADQLACPPLVSGLVRAHADALASTANCESCFTRRPCDTESCSLQSCHHHLLPPMSTFLSHHACLSTRRVFMTERIPWNPHSG
jgi:hypothetical protein